MILIYCSKITTRLQFIVSELFERRLGAAFEITNSHADFTAHTGPKINYSGEDFTGCLTVRPVKLLFFDSIEKQDISVAKDKWWVSIFFQTGGDIPFDIFAASFYLLSRYEEYLPADHDQHNRFLHTESCAFKHGFLHLPLVDLWTMQLKWQLENLFGPASFTPPVFKFISTIDIDFAFRYRGIGFIRYWMKLLNEFIHLRLITVLEQINVGINYKNDPYDTYSWIAKICNENKTELRYFVLLCNGTPYDKNIRPYHEVMRNFIGKLSKHYPVGLHPSYYSTENMDLLEHEKSLLEEYAHKEVTQSRQHFLRYKLPETFVQLIDAGITDDYSVGYSQLAGFRASTAHPFIFFNLIKNKKTALTLHPVTIMDVNYKNNPEYTPASAYLDIEQLMNQVKKVNGTFISLWHNSNLSRHEGWSSWREVFRKMHTLAASKQQQEID